MMLDKISFVVGALLYAGLVICGYLYCLLKVNSVVIEFLGGGIAFWLVHGVTTIIGTHFFIKVWRYGHGLD